ncbi:MAG: YbhB/YbcL family Raf kinase inhibitor-like protein [Candidatus Omnitrophica bacterium]|nr:YbhB/YbcL family Raf kinase inhibitor-like protein [Candidatus Omnitrophota bacterium]
MKSFAAVYIGLLISPALVWAGSPNISSTAFDNNAPIPSQYTCDGANINPPLAFHNIPAKAQSLALTVTDPDAPGRTWTHWILYNIPPDTKEIPIGSHPGKQGLNDFGKTAYGGPCPPPGELHHYIFRLYALDSVLNIREGETLSKVDKSLKGHVIAKAQLTGTYQKKLF